MKTILFIGSGGLVGKNFCSTYKTIYNIIEIDKHNRRIIKKLKPESINIIVYAAHPIEYKSPVISKSIIDTQVVFFNDILSLFSNRSIDFVYFSSGSIYINELTPISVNNKLNFYSNNPYILGKILSELILTYYKNNYKSVNIIRPFYIYGPFQNENMLFSILIKKLSNNEVVTINRDGGLKFNPIYVKDVINFLNNIIEKDTLGLNIYNLCGNETISLKELIISISRLLNVVPQIVENDKPYDNWVAVNNLPLNNTTSILNGLKELLK